MSTISDIDPTNVDSLIASAEKVLQSLDAGTDEHAKALSGLERLYKIRLNLIPEPTPIVVEEMPVDKDRVRFKDFLPLIATLAGTAIIVTAEAFGHTLTSKAWQERKQLK